MSAGTTGRRGEEPILLVLGSGRDRVYPRLMEVLRESGCPFATVDEDRSEDGYTVEQEEDEEAGGGLVFRIRGGGDCRGERPVGAIFVRHAVARTLDPDPLQRMGALQTALNRMLLWATPPVANRPACAYSNYSKPYQVGLLARAGFDVPRSLVTNIPDEARRFIAEVCRGRVIFKGASNVMTLAQRLKPEHVSRIDLLPHCPTLFQEYVPGVDYRVHVIGDAAFATRLISRDEDYRRSTLVAGEEIIAEAAEADLPADLLERCIAFTRGLGLIVSGMDFKESAPGGRIVALECNPFPQFTFYETRSGQPITKAVVDYLIQHRVGETNVFA